MDRRTALLVLFCLGGCATALQGQGFKIFNREVQVHGFASQGFAYTSDNNWLSMKTSDGSFAFTDFGANISMPLRDKLRVGVQIYDRNLGNLSNWHPSVDWAFIDYRFKPWFGLRGGKVKTALGLYNDTQDIDSLHTWAVLPQGIYALDLRSQTIAHVGGDAYGFIDLRKGGQVNYTVYGGRIFRDPYSGYDYGITGLGIVLGESFQATDEQEVVVGTDVRWSTPLKGLLMGVSAFAGDYRFKESLTFPGLPPSQIVATPSVFHVTDYYAEYSRWRFRFDAEYRRSPNAYVVTSAGPTATSHSETRGGFLSAAFRIHKRLEVGTYHSRFYPDVVRPHSPNSNHEFDQAISGRVEITQHIDFKVEGHFIDGYADTISYRGFYPQDNPSGLSPKTRALVVRTGFYF